MFSGAIALVMLPFRARARHKFKIRLKSVCKDFVIVLTVVFKCGKSL